MSSQTSPRTSKRGCRWASPTSAGSVLLEPREQRRPGEAAAPRRSWRGRGSPPRESTACRPTRRTSRLAPSRSARRWRSSSAAISARVSATWRRYSVKSRRLATSRRRARCRGARRPPRRRGGRPGTGAARSSSVGSSRLPYTAANAGEELGPRRDTRSSKAADRPRRARPRGRRRRPGRRVDRLELPPGQLVVDVDGRQARALELLGVVRERQARLAVCWSSSSVALGRPLAEEDRRRARAR